MEPPTLLSEDKLLVMLLSLWNAEEDENEKLSSYFQGEGVAVAEDVDNIN
jgi:hypothetical protein